VILTVIVTGYAALTFMGARFYLLVNKYVMETLDQPKYDMERIVRHVFIVVFWGWAFGIVRLRPSQARESTLMMIRNMTTDLKLTKDDRERLERIPDLVVG
jgi:hypothetical protein